MKKNLFVAIFGLLLVFYSCQQEDTVLSDQSVTQESKAANHFYGVATPPNQDPGTKGVAQRSKLWKNGSRINVTILNDPYGAYEKIKKYAREWEQYANVKFNIYNGYDKFINSDVRIEFDSNNGKSVT